MSTDLRVGTILSSEMSAVRFLVTAVGRAISLPTLDGHHLAEGAPRPCSSATRSVGAVELSGGRRYTDKQSGLTLLCVWPGHGVLEYNHRRMSPVLLETSSPYPSIAANA